MSTDVVRVRDEWAPTPKQEEFVDRCHEDGVDEIVFGGAIRSGKTQVCCKQIVAWAWRYGGPGWKAVVMRRTYRELADSTQAVMLRGDGALPPALPAPLMRNFAKADEMVTLHNGAEILFRSAENAKDAIDKIKNITMACFFVDQVEELDGQEYEQLYQVLLDRLSDPRGPRKGIMAANPGPEDHWVHQRFVDAKTRQPNTRYVHVTTFDNEQHLTDDTMARYKRLELTKPDHYRRYILGEWGAFGGKRFKSWEPQIHVVAPFEIPPWWEVMEGIDYGWTNPTAVVWVAIDPQERWLVFDEHVASETPISVHAREIKATRQAHGVSPSAIYLDPSAFAQKNEYESIAFELQDAGIFVSRAQNDRLGGWARLDELLSGRVADPGNQEEQIPRLRVFSHCKTLIREIGSARVKEGVSGQLYDDIEKRNDHCLDALRYICMSRPWVPSEPEEDNLDMRERYAQRLIDKAWRREQGGALIFGA